MLIHNLVATGSISYNGVNISYVTGSQTSLDGLNQFSASVNTTTGSLSSSIAILSGSYLTMSGSYSSASGSLSTRVTTIESKYATTGSNIFTGAQTVCANITSTGTIIAQTLNVQQVTSSIVYSSGSNIFGCQLTDVQQMTGSVRITGSLSTVGVSCFSSAVCAPTIIGTTNINTGTSCIVDSHMLNVNGDQASVNVGLSLRNTNATYPKVFGLTNVNGNLNLYDYTVNSQRLRIDTNGIACFACQKCAPGMDIMPSGIGVSTLGGIMRVVTTGTSTGIAVGQSNANRYTHIAANDIQVFNDDFFLTTRCAFPLSIGTCYTARLTFAATGIACFSCQVCAPQGIFINGAASLQAQFGQNNDATGTQTSAIDIISRNAANTAGFTFRIQNCATTCTTHLVYGGNTVMAFRCDGNVGIGTTTPFAKLEVVGGNNLPPSTGTQNYTVALRDPTSMVVDVGGSILLQGFKTSNTAIGNFAYIAGKKENGTAGNEAGYLSLGTFDSSGIPAERMRITSAGIACFASTVCSPRFQADNYGLFRASGFRGGLYTYDAVVGSGTDYGVTIFAEGGANNGNIYFAPGGSATKAVTITCFGEMLINTSTDFGDYKLQVNGNIAVPSSHVAISNGTQSANTIAARLYLGNRGYFNDPVTAPAMITSKTEGTFWYSGTAMEFYTTPGPDATSNSPQLRMTINKDGNIGAPSGTNIYNASDLRLKRNISNISDGLSKIMCLNPVKFNWIENYVPSEENKDMLGFIAQEIQNIIPEAVETFASGNSITVNDTVIDSPLRVNEKFIIPVLVKAIQEQQCKINILESCLGIN